MKILPVTPEERRLLTVSRGRGGRAAYSIIKEFLDSGLDVARIEVERPTSTVVPLLKSYIKKNKLDLKVSIRQGVIYIMKIVPVEAKELTPETVDQH